MKASATCLANQAALSAFAFEAAAFLAALPALVPFGAGGRIHPRSPRTLGDPGFWGNLLSQATCPCARARLLAGGMAWLGHP
jgi:hypothetical protein